MKMKTKLDSEGVALSSDPLPRTRSATASKPPKFVEWLLSYLSLPPANKVSEVYVFTCVCLSTGVGVHGRGGAWQGGMHGGRACVAGGMHGRGDMCGRGSMHATHAPCQILWDMVIWSMSGQYASYWNAFLLKNEFWLRKPFVNTRMHSSRMRTTHLLTVSHSIRWGEMLAQHPHPPPMQTPPGCRPPWSCALWCMLGSQPSPLWTDKHLWKHYLAPKFVSGR